MNFNNTWKQFLTESRFDFGVLKPKEVLNPVLWAKGHPSPKIIKRLMEISGDILKKLRVDVEVEDVILTGSMVSYNWHEKSDIDLHFLVDFAKINENYALVKQMLDEFRINWNKKHDIMIGTHEIEIYFQDINENHESNGVYSILDGQWIAEPVKLNPTLDLRTIEKKAEAIARSVDHISSLFASRDHKNAYNYASKLMSKIRRMRMSGLTGEGVYSVENLAFKMLRNGGVLKQLTLLRDYSYDQNMSIDLSENMLKNDINDQISNYFSSNIEEAKKDADILRKINLNTLKSTQDQEFIKILKKLSDEALHPREYHEKLNQIADENADLLQFPSLLIDYIESLDDRHFWSGGRKIFARWLGNAIWHAESEERTRSVGAFIQLGDYDNDIRYIVDYLNQAGGQIPSRAWLSVFEGGWTFQQMLNSAQEWHQMLAAGVLEDNPDIKSLEGKIGGFQTKEIVYDFEDGFTIVKVPAQPFREYSEEEAAAWGFCRDGDHCKEMSKILPNYENWKMKPKINDLDIEGATMGHCVGGYCERVQSGETTIYSLRNQNNKAHATIDVVHREMYRESPAKVVVDQIKGKGNAPPKEKYAARIRKWLADTFEKEQYENQVDYLNIIGLEELIERSENNTLPNEKLKKIIRSTKNPKTIEYFLKRSSEVGVSIAFQEGEQKPLESVDFVNGLIENDNITLEVALDLIRIALKYPDIEDDQIRVEALFLKEETPWGYNKKYDIEELSTKAWSLALEPAQRFTKPKFKNKLMILNSILEHTKNRELREEIMNFLLEEETINNSLKDPYRRDWWAQALRGYLKDSETVPRESLLLIHNSLKGDRVSQEKINLDGRFAAALSIPEEVAIDIANSPGNYMAKGKLLLNPNVDEKHKFDVLGRAAEMSNKLARWGTINHRLQQLGNEVWEGTFHNETHRDGAGQTTGFGYGFRDNPKGNLSKKILLWMADAGAFHKFISHWANDAYYNKYKTRHGFVKREEVPNNRRYEAIYEQEMEKLKEKINNRNTQEESVTQEIKKYLEGGRRRVLGEHDAVIQEIKDYFHDNEDDETFDDHPQSLKEKLLDPNEPAPWD